MGDTQILNIANKSQGKLEKLMSVDESGEVETINGRKASAIDKSTQPSDHAR